MTLSPEQAGWLLDAYQLDSERRLPMGEASRSTERAFAAYLVIRAQDATHPSPKSRSSFVRPVGLRSHSPALSLRNSPVAARPADLASAAGPVHVPYGVPAEN